MKRSRVLLAGLLLSWSATAQPTPEQSRVSTAVDVTIQNLDVVVTDAQGNSVHGLSVDDFELKQDGRPVRITNFQEVGAPAASEPTATAPEGPGGGAGAPADASVHTNPEPARPNRHIVLFLDSLRLPEPDQRMVFLDSMTSLLRKALGPGDQAMIVTWDGSMKSVLRFTGDLSLLERKLGEIALASARMPEEPAERERMAQDTQWFQMIATLTGGKAESAPTAPKAAAEAYARMKAKGIALKGLLATMGGLPGRKVLILASNRFSRYPGLEFYLGSRASYGDELDSRSRQFDAKEILASIVQTANAQDVTLYTVRTAEMESATVSAASSPAEDPGLQSNSLGAREQLVWANDMEALDLIAKETGGLSTGAVSRLETLTDRVTSDLASWYSLGFPTNRKPGDSSLSVHVKDSKLKVRVRRSLVVKTVEDQMKDRVLANLFRQDERSVLPITVLPRPATAKKNRYKVPIEVRIPINSLVLLPKGDGMTGAFSVFVATAGSKGDFSEPVRQTRPFEIARRDLEKAKLSYFTYELEVVTSSPEARISIGVWDEIGREAGFRILTNVHPAARPN